MTEGAAGRALERRQERRIVVRMPMHVRGTDHQGLRFEELTESENIGRTGAAFATWHNLDLGDDVEITIPLPKQKAEGETDFATRGRVVLAEPGERQQRGNCGRPGLLGVAGGDHLHRPEGQRIHPRQRPLIGLHPLHLMLGQLSQVGQPRGHPIDAPRRRPVVKAPVGEQIVADECRVVTDCRQADLGGLPSGRQRPKRRPQYPRQDTEAHRGLDMLLPGQLVAAHEQRPQRPQRLQPGRH